MTLYVPGGSSVRSLVQSTPFLFSFHCILQCEAAYASEVHLNMLLFARTNPSSSLMISGISFSAFLSEKNDPRSEANYFPCKNAK